MTIDHPYWFVGVMCAQFVIWIAVAMMIARSRARAGFVGDLTRCQNELVQEVATVRALKSILAEEIAYIYRLEEQIMLDYGSHPILKTRPPATELLKYVAERKWKEFWMARNRILTKGEKT
jgi:hypothetical protein